LNRCARRRPDTRPLVPLAARTSAYAACDHSPRRPLTMLGRQQRVTSW
jgi:hypothetical protein